MTTVLACNTPWGKGGQGGTLGHATGGLSSLSDLHVFCTEPAPASPPGRNVSLHVLPASRWTRLIQRTPVLRRRRDWTTLLSDVHFDRQVASALHTIQADLVVGVAGQSRHVLEQAREQGAHRWLYCLNTYLPFMKVQTDFEIATLGDPVRDLSPYTLRRFHQECGMADLIMVNSDVAKQTFVDAGISAGRVAVLRPAVDTERFRPVPKPDDTFRVLYVGAISPRKGVHYLVPAFLNAAIPKAELLLVGGVATPGLRIWLHDTLQQHPHIHNELYDFGTDDPRTVFGRCSVFVLASVEDGFGLVVLEAMASGLPVIVTTNCGAADLVQDGITGFVVPPRNPDAIAEKLVYLADHPTERAEMGRAARREAERHTQARYDQELRDLLYRQGLLDVHHA